jgi:hypothetical protein
LNYHQYKTATEVVLAAVNRPSCICKTTGSADVPFGKGTGNLLYVVVGLLLAAVLARGMVEERACWLLTAARVHLHHTSRVVSFNQLLTV